MKKIILLFLMGMVVLTGCGVSNETAEALALQALGEGGKILYTEHAFDKPLTPTVHVFVGKDKNGVLHYIRINGEKVIKHDLIEG